MIINFCQLLQGYVYFGGYVQSKYALRIAQIQLSDILSLLRVLILIQLHHPALIKFEKFEEVIHEGLIQSIGIQSIIKGVKFRSCKRWVSKKDPISLRQKM